MEHLHGPVEDVEDVLQRVALVDEELLRRAERGLDLEAQQLPAPLGGRLEDGEGQDLLVEVHGNVAAELLGVVVQDLEEFKIGFLEQRRPLFCFD